MKVSKNASGFNIPEIYKMLSMCNVIITSNVDAVPIISRMFPRAKVMIVRQDMPDSVIKQILVLSGEASPTETIEVVSVLRLYMKHSAACPPSDEHKEAAHDYYEAVEALSRAIDSEARAH